MQHVTWKRSPLSFHHDPPEVTFHMRSKSMPSLSSESGFISHRNTSIGRVGIAKKSNCSGSQQTHAADPVTRLPTEAAGKKCGSA